MRQVNIQNWNQKVPTVEDNNNLKNVKATKDQNGLNLLQTIGVTPEADENQKDMQQRVFDLQEIMKTAPILNLEVLIIKLNIEVINSTFLQAKLKLKINAQGLENSLRKKFDGITIFGNKELADDVIKTFYL